MERLLSGLYLSLCQFASVAHELFRFDSLCTFNKIFHSLGVAQLLILHCFLDDLLVAQFHTECFPEKLVFFLSSMALSFEFPLQAMPLRCLLFVMASFTFLMGLPEFICGASLV